jgi:hypothetical protein
VTENYDRQCVDEALNRYAEALHHATKSYGSCRTHFTLGGSAVGFLVGTPGTLGLANATGLAGALIGNFVGQLVCKDSSGLDDAVNRARLAGSWGGM